MKSTIWSHSHNYQFNYHFYLYPEDQEHLLVIHVLSDQRGFILENEGAFAMISAVVLARRFLCLFYIDRGFSGSKEQCYHLRHPRILLPRCRVHLLVFGNCLERCGRKLLFDLWINFRRFFCGRLRCLFIFNLILMKLYLNFNQVT